MEYFLPDYFAALSDFWNVPVSEIEGYWQDLNADALFLSEINSKIKDVDSFKGVQFDHVNQMRTFRCLLYMATRCLKPEVFIETGVQNGMSSSFILLGMMLNKKGHLYSIDIPPTEERILDQGTNILPTNQVCGWIIPDYLRERHTLRLMPSQQALPAILQEVKQVDIFLHDSDHCYSHMMFEVGLAWSFLKLNGLVVMDNIEQNKAFADLAAGTLSPSLEVASFNGPERLWKHGLLLKAKADHP